GANEAQKMLNDYTRELKDLVTKAGIPLEEGYWDAFNLIEKNMQTEVDPQTKEHKLYRDELYEKLVAFKHGQEEPEKIEGALCKLNKTLITVSGAGIEALKASCKREKSGENRIIEMEGFDELKRQDQMLRKNLSVLALDTMGSVSIKTLNLDRVASASIPEMVTGKAQEFEARMQRIATAGESSLGLKSEIPMNVGCPHFKEYTAYVSFLKSEDEDLAKS